jgi:hypothetical protein
MVEVIGLEAIQPEKAFTDQGRSGRSFSPRLLIFCE